MLLRPYGMGIEAVAIATVLSHILQATATFFYFRRKNAMLRINKIHLERDIFPEVVSVGISAMLLQVLILAQRAILYNAAAPFGTETWHVLLGAVLSIQAFVYQPLWGISQGFQPIAGTNYGAGEYRRLRRLFGVFVAGGTLTALVLLLPVQLAPGVLLSFFIQEGALVLQGVPYMRLFFSSYILYGFMILAMSFLQAVGRARWATLIVVLRQVLQFAPLAQILPGKLGIAGVWLAPVATDLLVSILAAVYLWKFLHDLKRRTARTWHNKGI